MTPKTECTTTSALNEARGRALAFMGASALSDVDKNAIRMLIEATDPDVVALCSCGRFLRYNDLRIYVADILHCNQCTKITRGTGGGR